ncbi:hypothetical protein DM02DRAFT_632819 [Periconia macrospinosa]|uniref:Rhodopsin domain-containing protein n=1 Tax=Periconia macrospinosa TaxID=97972 RepID=A0A2V1DEC8_9PLEO|nr:hypothetical protein DM02DRAFT_632819 [Periconia macrospinosa]
MAPRTLQPQALALAFVPTVVSTLIVCVRIWRRFVTHKFAIEDILLIIAQLLIIVLMVTTWVSFKLSWYGYHYYDIPKGALNPVLYQKWGYANAVVYNPILGLIKASFLITLLKLRSPKRNITLALWILFVINGLFTIVAPFVCAFQCSPVSKFWDRKKPGSCLDAQGYTYGTISIVLATDVAVLIMPTWILYNLQMPFRRKAMYIAFMSFGIAFTGIGAFRLYVFVQLFTAKAHNPDSSYGMRQGLSNMEVSIAAIGACGGTVKWMLGCCIPFFNDSDTPRLSKYNGASRSSGSNELGSVGGTAAANNGSNRSWRNWGRRSGRRSGGNTMASQDDEFAAPPPPVVWKKVETRKRERNQPTTTTTTTRARAEKRADGAGNAQSETQRSGGESNAGTFTTYASSRREARPREVV